ncbi:MAG: hypothetical protein HGA75_16045 [Thiobacillus sp.]|nr:hypothetical protein [Thiobacillus sp.]
MHPVLAEIKTQLLEAGCAAAAMSGSGPTMFGVCADESKARRVAEDFGAAHAVTIAGGVRAGVERTD